MLEDEFLPNCSMGCGKQEVFGVMGTSVYMNRSNVFGISSKEEHCKGQVS